MIADRRTLLLLLGWLTLSASVPDDALPPPSLASSPAMAADLPPQTMTPMPGKPVARNFVLPDMDKKNSSPERGARSRNDGELLGHLVPALPPRAAFHAARMGEPQAARLRDVRHQPRRGRGSDFSHSSFPPASRSPSRSCSTAGRRSSSNGRCSRSRRPSCSTATGASCTAPSAGASGTIRNCLKPSAC